MNSRCGAKIAISILVPELFDHLENQSFSANMHTQTREGGKRPLLIFRGVMDGQLRVWLAVSS